MYTTNLRKVGGSICWPYRPRCSTSCTCGRERRWAWRCNAADWLWSRGAAAVYARRVAGAMQSTGTAQQGRARMAGWQAGGRVDLMKRGEIWLVGLDPTQGHEQKGRHPVLIVSTEAFNRVTKVPVVLPITSGGDFAGTAGFGVTLEVPERKQEALSAVPSPARSISARAAERSWKALPTRSWMRYWRSWQRFLNKLLKQHGSRARQAAFFKTALIASAASARCGWGRERG